MSKPTILIIEDERALADVLALNLQREGFEALVAYDGQDGLRQAQVRLPELIVLDLMLPVKTGEEVCRELRAGSRTRDIPIVMVTAKAEEADELIGLALGADDYVTKPYSMRVLIQRIKKELRHRQVQDDQAATPVVECQGVTIDRHRHRVLHRGEVLALTPTEFRLLEALVRAAGDIVPHLQLARAGWPAETDPDLLWLKPHLARLRSKVEAAGGPAIVAVRGVGYRIVVEPDSRGA